jgi:1,2-diacylglycerol 3-alpha-glucosyltransferase
MKLPIKIVFLTPGFAADETDTTSIPALQLFARFLTFHYDNINLRIVTIQYPVKSGSYSWQGIPVYSAGGGMRKITRLVTWLKVMLHLNRLREKEGIDIVHSFWLTETSLIGLVFCRLTGIRFLATAMGQDVKAENKYLHILRFLSFKMTVISQFQVEFVKNLKKVRLMKVIPFGVDRSYFNDNQGSRTIDILGVGSLNSIKNYPEFIDIVKSVTLLFPDLRCRIIGEGMKRQEIENTIKEKELQDNIVLAGNLSYDRTIEEMHVGKILLHTSTFEGQALVITEALAAGLYVVSHPVGIASSLQTGKLMTGKTGQDLARHIIDILQKKELDFTPQIHYSIDDTCKEYHEIYLELMKGKSPGKNI